MNAKSSLVPGDWIRTPDDFDNLAPGSYFMTPHGSVFSNHAVMFEEDESKLHEILRRIFPAFVAPPAIMSDAKITERYLPAYVVMTKVRSPFRDGIPPEASVAVIMNARDAIRELDFGSVVRMGNGQLVDVVDLDEKDGIPNPKMGLAVQGGDWISLADAVYPLIHLTPKGM